MNHLLILLIVTFLGFECVNTPSDTDTQKYCYSFDERQCGVDPYASLGLSDDERKSAIKNFLIAQNIHFSNLKIIDPFYDATCDACAVCPEDHKYFIKIAERDSTKLNSLNLFNLNLENCEDVF